MNIQEQIADAVEVERLRNELEQFRKTLFNLKTDLIRENHVEYDKGWKDCASAIHSDVCRILGV